MKIRNFFFLITIILTLIILCGCNNSKISNENQNIDQQVSSEIDENVEEKEEEFAMTKVISLKENPTTGYIWSYEIEDESIAIVESDEYTAKEVAEGIVGSGGVHTFRLSGLKEGTTTIKFTHSRPWESFQPLETEIYSITVDSNNLISIVQK